MGYESFVRVKKVNESFQDWLFVYVKNNPLKLISALSITLGFLLYAGYAWKIQFFSFPDKDVAFFLVTYAFFGFCFLFSLVGVFIFPSIVWRQVGFSTSFKKIASHFLLVLGSCELLMNKSSLEINFPMPYLYEHYFVILLCLGFILLLFLFWNSVQVRGKDIEGWLEKLMKLMLIAFCTSVFPIFILYVFLSLLEQGEMLKELPFGWIASSVLTAILVVLSYMLNSLVVSLRNWKEIFIPISMVMLIIFIISPFTVSTHVAQVTKIGGFYAGITLTKQGFEIYENSLIAESLDKKGGENLTISNAYILSRVGKEVLFQVQESNKDKKSDKKRKLGKKKYLIDKKDIFAISLYIEDVKKQSKSPGEMK